MSILTVGYHKASRAYIVSVLGLDGRQEYSTIKSIVYYARYTNPIATYLDYQRLNIIRGHTLWEENRQALLRKFHVWRIRCYIYICYKCCINNKEYEIDYTDRHWWCDWCKINCYGYYFIEDKKLPLLPC